MTAVNSITKDPFKRGLISFTPQLQCIDLLVIFLLLTCYYVFCVAQTFMQTLRVVYIIIKVNEALEITQAVHLLPVTIVIVKNVYDIHDVL